MDKKSGFIFGNISESRFNGVHPNMVGFMKDLLDISPYDFSISQGVRTVAEQQKLYARGRTINGVTTPGPIITKVDGVKVKSNHQPKADGLGYAVDIAILVQDPVTKKWKPDWNISKYKELYELAEKEGLLEKWGVEWGGNCFINKWRLENDKKYKPFIDGPHWQIKGANHIR